MTPAEQAAWQVARAATTAALDISIREMLAAFRLQFPTVDALWGVHVVDVENPLDPRNLPDVTPTPPAEPRTVYFDRVRLGDRVKARDEVKPENATAIDWFLTEHLAVLLVQCHDVQDALYRWTSHDGLIWVDRTTPFEPVEG
jgi:hypothetical protein